MIHYGNDYGSQNNIVPFTEGIKKVRTRAKTVDPIDYFGDERLYSDTEDGLEGEFSNTNMIIESKVDEFLMDKLEQYREEVVETKNNIIPFYKKRKHK
jgi:hypothetical protein